MATRRQAGDSHVSNPNAPTPLEFLGFHVPEWYADALCAQADPEAWFPEKGGSLREAKAVCLRCPVQAECVDQALSTGERYGLWGGLSERQRRKILRRPTGRPPNHKETA
jgi:WhiB family redox-sensing transcriptional regulator